MVNFRVLTLTVLGIAMFAFLTFPVQAQAPAAKMLVEDIVSQDTFFLFTLPDLAATKARFQNTSLAKFWNDPEMQQALQPIFKAIAENENVKGVFSEIEKSTGQSLSNIIEVFNGQFAIAADSIPLNGKTLRVLLTIDAGAKKDRLEIILNKITAKAGKEMGGAVKLETFQVNNLNATSMDFGDMKICYVFINTNLILTTDKAMLEEAVKNYTEKSSFVLSKNANFVKAKEKCGPNYDGLLYVSTEAIYRMVGDQIPKEAQDILGALGLKDVKFITASNTFLPNGNFKGNFYVHVPGEKKGLIKIAALPSAPSEPLLKNCPKNAVSVSVVNLNLKNAWDTMLTAAKAVTKDNPSVNIEEIIKQYEMQLGFSVGNDFLASFGDQFMFYSVFPEGGGLIPDTLCYVKLKNKNKFNECISALMTGSPLAAMYEQSSLAYKDTTITYFNTRLAEKSREMGGMFDPEMMMRRMGPEAMGMMMMNAYFFSSYFVTKDDYIVASTSTQSLKRAIDRLVAAPVMPSVMESEFFKKNVTPQLLNSGVFGYTDSNKLIAPYYNTILPVGYFLQVFAQAAGVPLDMARFPTGETVSKYFAQDVFTYKADNDGLSIESNGSLNLMSLAGGTALVAIVAAIAIPSLLSSKAASQEMGAAMTLKSLVSAEAVWQMSDTDRNGVKDYWVADMSGMYRVIDPTGNPVQCIDISFAKADASPAMESEDGVTIIGPQVSMEPMPKNGYYYMAIPLDADGMSIATDADGDGCFNENVSQFAFCAYPAEYGRSGRYTYIVNESGNVWKQDTFGMPVTMWPGEDPSMAGWELAD
ncbi:MAG: DUF2950 family protein [Planctomycetes bacterium]|nr:DUF2950 family protein [Planctomycetota bacterium]